ncbi:AAA domain-containing protein [Cedecea neteri]|uniref:AAA domain-containing protein n=1 Tax=Cedecea neteri TaxID=158822 RepID=UPI0028935183|nr:AAA domain-containing protein [Cedecea neteri]WNJ81218.1 AAA domain-containing protein [Cedecea neteri]
MVTIVVDGEDKTAKISNWTLYNSKSNDTVHLTCHFPSGKTYTRPLSVCRVIPTVETNSNILFRKGQPNAQRIDKAQIIGNKYALIKYVDSEKIWIYKFEDIQLVTESSLKQSSVFSYFRRIAEQRALQASAGKENIAGNIVRQMDKLIAHPDTALEAYCSGQNASRPAAENFIYPFGLNESQMQAIQKAFSHQISVIEGPPGTGKTQTILNIIANILLSNGTVAVVSNNNSAVDNVYEKLGKVGLDYLVAKLGSTEKRAAFFDKQPSKPFEQIISAPEKMQLTEQIKKLKNHLSTQGDVAKLQAEIDELNIEDKYLQQWLEEHTLNTLPDVTGFGLKKEKITDLMAFINAVPDDKLDWRHRLSLLFRFGIFRTKPLNTRQKRQTLFIALQHYFYRSRLQQAQRELIEKENFLEKNKFEELLQHVTSGSLAFLKQYLKHAIPVNIKFSADTYHEQFADFIQRYPIIGSSTHSIANSLAQGKLLDYVIIDEASQQDIVPGILALACARNVIVVGDRKQLPHVPEKTAITAPKPYYDCNSKSLLDSLFGVYDESLPVTLLKEHYRCHPRIIHFCNKQFYDNQLVVMTRDKGEDALSLIITAKGNHARGYKNQREIESFMEVSDSSSNSCGFISPYNAQVSLSEQMLPSEFITSTVHKFQGRECEQIVFSTVIDKKMDAKTLDFVDDPHLINVAVSRAQKRFTLTTGENVFTGNNKHIAALVRYMKYYSNEAQIHYSPVVSAFDLLYQEYDRSLDRLRRRLSAKDSFYLSEQIATRVIKDVLQRAEYHSLVFHKQILLQQLVKNSNIRLSQRQKEFLAQGASCDFVFYFHVGKLPLAVIEIDGHHHEMPKQRERDELKNTILKESGIALLRLKTTDSKVEEKIANFLLSSMLENQVELVG